MTAHNPDEFQWANTFWECFERSHKNGLLEIMRSIIRSAVSVAVEDMTRFRDNAVEDMAMWMERAGKLAGGVDVATLIREAVNDERERCAGIVDGWDSLDEDHRFINPELGFWFDGNCTIYARYIPYPKAIAARIREPKRG